MNLKIMFMIVQCMTKSFFNIGDKFYLEVAHIIMHLQQVHVRSLLKLQHSSNPLIRTVNFTIFIFHSITYADCLCLSFFCFLDYSWPEPFYRHHTHPYVTDIHNHINSWIMSLSAQMQLPIFVKLSVYPFNFALS